MGMRPFTQKKRLFFLFGAFLVGHRAGRFARRLAAGLALAASGAVASLDAGLDCGLNVLHCDFLQTQDQYSYEYTSLWLKAQGLQATGEPAEASVFAYGNSLRRLAKERLGALLHAIFRRGFYRASAAVSLAMVISSSVGMT